MSAPRTLAKAAVGGLLLAVSLPPWPGSTGTWLLGVVGAALVFAAVDDRRLRIRVGAGMAAGLGLYLPGLWWMRDFSLPGFLATVILESAILAGATALVPGGARSRAGPGWRLAAFPAALVVAEAVRGVWPFGGLPLAGIELGQVAGPLAPAARLGGRLLVVGLVALAGAAAATAVRRRRHGPVPVEGVAAATAVRWRRPGLVPALAAVAVVVATAVAGALAPSGRYNGTLTVAAVQGGGERGLRAVDNDSAPVFDAHLDASAGVGSGADVVLWPEDVVDADGVFAGSPQEQALSALAAELRTTLVVGITEDAGDDDHFLNASVVFGPDGRVVDRYDKVHRVPFGEYIPARSFFARLGDVSAVPRDAVAGTGPGVVDTPAGRFGVLISYEVFFQDRSRDAVRAGGRLLLVPTNASSYRDAQVPAQQLAVARLRALETGRWVVQAAPTGYSAVVDHHGHVLARSGLGGAAILRHEVQLRTGRTVFVSLGPAPVLLAAAATLALAHLRRRARSRVTAGPPAG